MTVVDEICNELSAKHGDKYTPEQYRCWANLIQLQKHDSYDSPPKKRFFAEKSGITVPTQSVGAGVSPSKRITMHSECVPARQVAWSKRKGNHIGGAVQRSTRQDYVRYSESLSTGYGL